MGTKKKNPLGLYDMHGNVWLWCSDAFGAYDGDATDPTGADASKDLHPSRVLRGGSWGCDPRICRSAFRYGVAPDLRNGDIGFRLCLDF